MNVLIGIIISLTDIYIKNTKADREFERQLSEDINFIDFVTNNLDNYKDEDKDKLKRKD